MIYFLLGLISFWFAILSRIPQFVMKLINILFTKNLTRLKPFDCSKCLGFWIGLIVSLVCEPYVMCLVYAPLTSLTATLTEKIYIKYIQ